MKKIGICLLGILLSFVLLSIFVYITVNFTEASEFAKENYREQMLNNPNENPFERLEKTIWRFDYIFNPIIVITVSLIISLLDRSKHKLLLAFIGLLPFIAAYLAASSFSARSLIFSAGYLGIAYVVVSLIPVRESKIPNQTV